MPIPLLSFAMKIFSAVLLSALFCLPAQAESLSPDLPIHDAARTGSGQAVQSLLAADAKMRDARTALGSQPLHLAAMNPDLSAMQALLRAGANPNARDNEGATPLHMAAYASRPQHARLLLEAGADPLAKTDNGRDATAMARKVKSDETAGIISLWILKACKAGKPC